MPTPRIRRVTTKAPIGSPKPIVPPLPKGPVPAGMPPKPVLEGKHPDDITREVKTPAVTRAKDALDKWSGITLPGAGGRTLGELAASGASAVGIDLPAGAPTPNELAKDKATSDGYDQSQEEARAQIAETYLHVEKLKEELKEWSAKLRKLKTSLAEKKD